MNYEPGIFMAEFAFWEALEQFGCLGEPERWAEDVCYPLIK